MNVAMKNRIENAQYSLIIMSTKKLVDDRRLPLRPPVAKPATATIAEILAAKEVN